MKLALFENDWAYEYDLMKLWERFSMKTSDTDTTPAAGFGEPWILVKQNTGFPNDNQYEVQDANGNDIMCNTPYYPLQVKPVHQARVVACVNALAGAQNPEEFLQEIRDLFHECVVYVAMSNPCPGVYVATLNNRLRAMLAKLDAGPSK